MAQRPTPTTVTTTVYGYPLKAIALIEVTLTFDPAKRDGGVRISAEIPWTAGDYRSLNVSVDPKVLSAAFNNVRTTRDTVTAKVVQLAPVRGPVDERPIIEVLAPDGAMTLGLYLEPSHLETFLVDVGEVGGLSRPGLT